MSVDQLTKKQKSELELLAEGCRVFAKDDREFAESILTAGTESHPDHDE